MRPKKWKTAHKGRQTHNLTSTCRHRITVQRRLRDTIITLKAPAQSTDSTAQAMTDISFPNVIAGEQGSNALKCNDNADSADGVYSDRSAGLLPAFKAERKPFAGQLCTPRTAHRTLFVTNKAQLDKALERGQLEVFYEPKLYVAREQLLGAEALVRWRHPEFGLVSPAGLSVWRINCANRGYRQNRAATEACRQAMAWCTMVFPGMQVAANISLRAPQR